MKTVDFERILKQNGFSLVRSSGHHVYSNGTKNVAIPRGREINKMVARRLLKEIGLN